MSKGDRPNFYGLITIPEGNGMFQKIGKIAVWKQRRGTGDKRPPFTGNVEVNGQKFKVALWENVPQ